MKRLLLVAVITVAGLSAQHDEHHAAVNARGDRAMGFSHEKTTHHFLLTKDGGTIQVEANDAKDTQSRDQIRRHLTHIAVMFSAGNFQTPMLIHDQTPPGVPAMKEMQTAISYGFAPTPKGGQVRITTKDPKAVQAIHEFLRFQISDHQTGDPTEIRKH